MNSGDGSSAATGQPKGSRVGSTMMALLLLSAVPVAAATPCPAGLTQLESFGYPEEVSSKTYTACEDLSHSDGDLLLLPAAGAAIRFPKRLDSMFQAINTSFAGTGEGMKALWMSSKDDMAIKFLGDATTTGADVSYAAVAAAVAPMVANGGADGGKEATKCGEKAGFGCSQASGVHTFTGSRESSAAQPPTHPSAGRRLTQIVAAGEYLGDVSLDSHGVDVNPGDWDYPSMNQHVGKYGRTPSVFKDPLVCSTEMPAFVCPPNSTRVGLVGGSLPVLHWAFQRRAGGWISQTVTPNPNSTAGSALQVMFRFLKVDSSGKLLAARYFDTIVR